MRIETSITSWLVGPPAEIEVVIGDGRRFTRPRPEGFDLDNLRGLNMLYSYQAEYAARLRTMRQDAKALDEAIAFLTERYDSWRPVP